MKSKTVEEFAESYCLTLPEETRTSPKELFAAYNGFIAGFRKSGTVVPKSRQNPVDKYKTLINIVCKYYEFSYQQVNKPSRKRELAQVRQLCMYFGDKYIECSLAKLGEPFGKDHSTVLYSIKVINNLLDTSQQIREDVNNITNKIDYEL